MIISFFIISKFVKLSDLSKTIPYYSLDHIYKPTYPLNDSLENRLKREGYLEGIVKKNNKTYYIITPKGKKLLKGWISFLNVYT